MIRYTNNVTGETLNHPPPAFRGGILADAMGLGKTLSAIALLTSGVQGFDQRHNWENLGSPLTGTAPTSLKTTLVIVPLSRESL